MWRLPCEEPRWWKGPSFGWMQDETLAAWLKLIVKERVGGRMECASALTYILPSAHGSFDTPNFKLCGCGTPRPRRIDSDASPASCANVDDVAWQPAACRFGQVLWFVSHSVTPPSKSPTHPLQQEFYSRRSGHIYQPSRVIQDVPKKYGSGQHTVDAAL